MFEEFDLALRSGTPVILVNTTEVNRAIEKITEFIERWNKKHKNLGYKISIWDDRGWTIDNNIVSGTDRISTAIKYLAGSNGSYLSMKNIEKLPKGLYIMKHANLYWEDSALVPQIIQAFNKLEDSDFAKHRHLVIVGNIESPPEEIASISVSLDFPLPTAEDYKTVIEDISSDLGIKFDKDIINIASDACIGMPFSSGYNAIKTSLAKGNGEFDIPYLYRRKSDIVKQTGLLEYVPNTANIEDIGGLGELKNWLNRIGYIYKNRRKAEDKNIPIPKACLLTGVSGCGKTLIAKATANLMNVPLFRCDIGRLLDKYVGSTEKNTNYLFKLIDTVAPAVILIDEVEKMFAGAGSDGSLDGGVTSRLIGNFLYYMQERTSPAFFIGTANDVSKLTPEMLRRFADIWFIDLPYADERAEIFRIHIRKHSDNKFNFKKFANLSAGFTGAEIEKCVNEAVIDAFVKEEDLNERHIVSSIESTQKLYKTKKEEIDALREWAVGRAKIANK